MNTVKILEAARDLITDESKLMSGQLFDNNGETVEQVLAAECFCMLGAVVRVEVEQHNQQIIDQLTCSNYNGLENNEAVKALAYAINQTKEHDKLISSPTTTVFEYSDYTVFVDKVSAVDKIHSVFNKAIDIVKGGQQ